MQNAQKTIKDTFTITGQGIHTANKASLTFIPAPVNSGVNFVRVDLQDKPRIKVDCRNISESSQTLRRTTLSLGGSQVQTVEHLMAVLCGMQIDNLTIEIDNNEIPGLDGSGAEFMNALKKSGIVQQEAAKKYYALREAVFVEESDAKAAAFPANDFSVSYTLDYDHPFLKSQYKELIINPENFEKEIASARTFCLMEEADDLQGKGLGRGASYQNTLVVSKTAVIENTLRFPDEFVRHKILDLIGDLYVLGTPLKAKIIAVRSGHSLNLKLLKKIYQQKIKAEQAAIVFGDMPNARELDVSMIMKILPHRYPFLLVDKILSLENGKRAVGLKNVTINENFFAGHFPGKPVMPGVLIVEAMAQVGGIMMLSPDENRGKIAYFMAINEAKFRKVVVPGDQLIFEVTAGRIKSRTGQVFGKAYVNGKLAAEAELMFALGE